MEEIEYMGLEVGAEALLCLDSEWTLPDQPNALDKLSLLSCEDGNCEMWIKACLFFASLGRGKGLLL